MTWAEFAGSGAHNWLTLLGLLVVFIAWARASRLEREAARRAVGNADPILIDHAEWQELEAEKTARAARLGYSRDAAHA